MAGTFTDDLKQKVLQHMFTAGADPIASDSWMSLVKTTAPTKTVTNPSTNEADYTGYTRIDITGTSAVTAWTVATQGSGYRADNDSDIDFPQNTGSSQTILGALVSDTVSGDGDVWWFDGALNVAVGTNETPTVPAGSATFDIDI